MNKKILFSLSALFLLAPLSTHAAFSFTRVGQTGDAGYSHSTSNSPTYREQYWNGIAVDPNTGNVIAGPYYYPSPGSATVCNDAIARSGLSDTVDTYCVFEGFDSTAMWSSGDLGSGSGGGTSNGSATYYNILLSIYQTPIQPHSVAQMQSQLNAYGAYNFWLLYSSQWGAPQPTYASDPGYRDVCPVMNSDDPGVNYSLVAPGESPSNKSCDVYHHTAVVNQKPVATLTANPASIVTGNSSLLTYSCSNDSTSASIDNGVGSVTPVAAGSKSVTPGATTTYTLTCTNAAGSATASATVTVTTPLSASCTVSPSTTTTGTNVTWTGTASGGTGAYAYTWSGTESLSGSSASVSKSYSTTGTKTGSVTVTSGTQSVTSNCTNSVTVSSPPVTPLSCTVSNATPPLNTAVTYTASGASAPYTWTAADGGSYGTNATASRSFSVAGSYAMTVSKSGYTSATCPTVTAGNSGGACTNPTGTISANPGRIHSGDSTTITYSATGIGTSCTITGPGVATTIPSSSCTVPGGNVSTGALTTQSVYILTCDGVERGRTVVNVLPKIIEF
ncbi:MAG TPA: hypothetical protein VN086_02105 [Candidatus Paceibacterota bacterium]|nr:hypothetical protein [Candidatus Paceibacterota bacterium]